MEEKEKKKKTTTKRATTKKKNTTTKKTTKTVKKKTTPKVKKDVIKEVIEPEKIMPYIEEDKVMPYIEEDKVMPYIEEDKVMPYIEEEKVMPYVEKEVPVVKEEKKKTHIVIYLLILFFLICMGFVWFLAIHFTTYQKGNFTEIGTFQDKMLFTDYLIVEDEYELSDYFPTKSFRGLDFDHHVYAVIEIAVDTCSESNFKPVGYQVIGKTVHVQMEYKASCGVCAPEYLYYLLELERDYQYDGVEVEYKATNNPHCDPNVAYKPVIYLYPEEETEVFVQLGRADVLTVTYPDYQDGWNVIAHPDGTLQANNREYYGLFWEGENHPASVHEEGFVVKGEDTVPFLEKALKELGLTDKEANEFIIYWYPKLKNNPYNYIYFETEEEINHYMPLTIQPTPDQVIRIQMDYKPLMEEISVQEQTLKTPTREGFVVVEWGGSIIKD